MIEDYPRCKRCGAPILTTLVPPPARRAATTYYNMSRYLYTIGLCLCERCKSNCDNFISFIEEECNIKLMDYQKKVITNFIINYNREKYKKICKEQKNLLGTRFKCSSIDEF